MSCRNGGNVSIAGVYGGFVDRAPFGSIMGCIKVVLKP